jgi:hypothetical protein
MTYTIKIQKILEKRNPTYQAKTTANQDKLFLTVLNLVPVQGFLFLIGEVINSKNNLARLVVFERVAHSLLVITQLTFLSDSNCVRTFIRRYKFFLVVHFPAKNSQVPYKSSSNLKMFKLEHRTKQFDLLLLFLD